MRDSCWRHETYWPDVLVRLPWLGFAGSIHGAYPGKGAQGMFPRNWLTVPCHTSCMVLKYIDPASPTFFSGSDTSFEVQRKANLAYAQQRIASGATRTCNPSLTIAIHNVDIMTQVRAGFNRTCRDNDSSQGWVPACHWHTSNSYWQHRAPRDDTAFVTAGRVTKGAPHMFQWCSQEDGISLAFDRQHQHYFPCGGVVVSYKHISNC